MTRILAISLRYPPYVEGGYELLTRDAVEGLRGRGHEVAVLCGAGERLQAEPGVFATLAPAIDGGVNLFEQDRNSGVLERLRTHFYRPSNHRATKRAILSFKPDIVVYFNLGMASLAPVLAARGMGIPCLGYLCDRWAENLWLGQMKGDSNKRGRLFFFGLLWTGLRAWANLAPVLCASEWLRGKLLQSGVAPDGVGVLPTGLSPQMESLATATAEVPSREVGQKLRVIATSMLWHGKGQHILLQAFARAVGEGLDAELHLAGADPGDGAYQEQLEVLASEARIEEQVHFLGMLSPTEVSKQLATSHIFVLPSLWGEPFGLSTIEAMAHGLCCVVSDSGASPELLGGAGVVVETGSIEGLAASLLRLGGDEEGRQRLGRQARTRALEHFDRQSFLEGLESACDAAIAKVSA
ncbi:MAG: glycosyltransferase involved in cell wall biosynthesis [Bacteroidia bacterium]|jgi:glycosyltransferase involved in cell wall biosynthesis